jgi:RNA polymerase sigma-70 factor (ECF subfamily)
MIRAANQAIPMADPVPGSTADFGRLYVEHRDRLLRVASGLTGSSDRADELVAEAFARAFQAFGAFRNEASFGTWIHRILLNLVYDGGKRREEELPESVAGARSRDPEVRAEAREIGARIDVAVGRLSRMQREVFLMRELDDLRHAEIAARLEISESTSKVHYFHAVRRMREELHDLV